MATSVLGDQRATAEYSLEHLRLHKRSIFLNLCITVGFLISLLFCSQVFAACKNAERVHDVEKLTVLLDYSSVQTDMPDLARETLSKIIMSPLAVDWQSCFGKDKSIPIRVVDRETKDLFEKNNLIVYMRLDGATRPHFKFNAEKRQFSILLQIFMPASSDAAHLQTIQGAYAETWLFNSEEGPMIQNLLSSAIDRFFASYLGIDTEAVPSEHGHYFDVQ